MTITTQQAVQLAREAGGTVYTNRHYKDSPAVALSSEQLKRLIKLARNQALEKAKQVAIKTCSESATPYGDGFNTAALVIEAAIESLKDNTL